VKGTVVNAINRALRSALPSLSAGINSLAPKCASERCHPRSRFSLSFRSEGISIDNDWYCGPECFEEAAESQIARLCAGRKLKLKLEPRKPRMPLGLMMLSLGHITSEQLQLALEHQRQNGGRIGEVLIALGFANQAGITAALAAQWGHPVLSLQNRELQEPHQIPTRLMELYSMLPIHFVAQTNKLVIGFAELVENRILSTIETMLECRVIPCFITRDDFESQLQCVRLRSYNEQVVFDQATSIHEIARIVQSYAWQINAMSTSFGMCSDYVWSRLQGPRVAVDLLSRIKSF
jgi:Type II secretion system (T2SS), protein E, N-terminal domain